MTKNYRKSKLSGRIRLFLITVMVIMLTVSVFAGAVSAGGDEPNYDQGIKYEIKSLQEFLDFVNNVSIDNYYLDGDTIILKCDLDLSQICNATSGKSWEPIGGFKSRFDGNGHTISNLYINKPDNDDVGLFKSVLGYGNIRNLGLIDVNVTGKKLVGGLVGTAYGGRIENCYVIGTVTGYDDVGGLAGRCRNTINCYMAGTVTGNNNVGGVVGGIGTLSTVTNCYVAGTVTCNDGAGGLVGNLDFSFIYNSVALNPSVSVTTGKTIGRLAGYWNMLITKCYAWEGMTNGQSSPSLLSNGTISDNNGADVSSVGVWADIEFYRDTLEWGSDISYDSDNRDTVWKIKSGGADATGWGIPYLSSLGAPSDPELIESIQHLKPLTVTYNGNGKTSGDVPDNQKYSKNILVTVPDRGNLQKTGYTFAGWYGNSAGTGTNYSQAGTFTITSNTNLYANWTANTYRVTFDENIETSTTPSSKEVTYDSSYGELPTITRTGLTFAGWNTKADGTGDTITSSSTVKIAGDHTLYAKWTSTVDVKFDESKGIVTCVGGTMVKSGDKYVISDIPYNSELTFTFAPSTGSTVKDVKLDGSSQKQITTLKQNIKSAHTIEVEFGPQPTEKPVNPKPVPVVVPPETKNAGVEEASVILSEDDPVDQEVKVSAQIIEPEKDFGEIPSNQDVKIVIKIDAKYQPVNGIATVKFSIDKNKISNPDRVNVFHNVFDAASNKWIQKPVDNLKVTSSGDVYVIEFTTATFSYFSVAETRASPSSSSGGSGESSGGYGYVTYEVTFDSQGGSSVPSQSNLNQGSKLTQPATPSKSGYTFDGWYTVSGTKWDFASDQVTASITLYARWTDASAQTVATASVPAQPAPTKSFAPALGILIGLIGAGVILRRK